jgi:hypothetical protein
MRADIVAGAAFPDYELTDHTGARRKLSELQGPDPMILVLSRGGFCPRDQRQAEGLVHPAGNLNPVGLASCHEGLPVHRPSERLRHGGVEVGDETLDSLLEVVL